MAFAIMLGAVGMAVAQGGSGSVGVTATLLPAGTSVVCSPATIDAVGSVYTTATTCTAMGSPDGTTVSFATSDATGQFSATTCSLLDGSCVVTYSDIATAGANPTITASFPGDGITYGANQETTAVTVNPLTCGIDVSPSSVDLSAGAQPTMTVTNTGNINGELYASGSDWTGASQGDMGSGSVSWTVYGVNSAPVITPLAVAPADLGALAPGSDSAASMQVGVNFPTGIAADSYSTTLSLTTSC